MTVTLLKAVIAAVPAFMLLVGSAVLFAKKRDLAASLQLLGASGLMVVVFAHVCEALALFPIMNWGLENSAGHYLDLASAGLGLTAFPIGYVRFTLAYR